MKHDCHPCVAVHMLLALANAVLLALCNNAVTVDATLRVGAASCRCCRHRHHPSEPDNCYYIFIIAVFD